VGAAQLRAPGAAAPAASEETVRQLRRKVHQTVQAVSRDFEAFEFNTIISSLMELLNALYSARDGGAAGTPAWHEAVDSYLKMLAPSARTSRELWTCTCASRIPFTSRRGPGSTRRPRGKM